MLTKGTRWHMGQGMLVEEVWDAHKEVQDGAEGCRLLWVGPHEGDGSVCDDPGQQGADDEADASQGPWNDHHPLVHIEGEDACIAAMRLQALPRVEANIWSIESRVTIRHKSPPPALGGN